MKNFFLLFPALAGLLLLGACSPTSEPILDPAPELETHSTPIPQTQAGPGEPLVVFLGDSLTAGLGLPVHQAFPALVQERLGELNIPIRILNAGISGDTTAGGRSRLSWLLQGKPDLVVLALGANDGLRGLPLEMSEQNLRAIMEQTLSSGADLLLAGMLIPPSYGPEYAGDFQEIFPRLAGDFDVAFLPFLLEGVAAIPELNLEDGIHPNARGHELVALNLLPHVVTILEARSRPASTHR
jgi:acyl-CoA thioesterase-1